MKNIQNVDEWQDTIEKLCILYRIHSNQLDDIKQLCFISLIEADKRYDPAHESKAKFKTFAITSIKRCIFNYVNKSYNIACREQSVGIIAEEINGVSNWNSITNYDNKDFHDHIVRKIMDIPHGDQFIEHVLYGKTFKDIAENDKVTPQRIEQRVSNVKSKLKFLVK
jgi:RNA polymerase sigma factor (sigma-70 family)